MSTVVCNAPEEARPGREPASAPASLNCLSVDVEEYFHAEAFHHCLHPRDWPAMPRRTAPFVERIAELLDRYDSRATFFVLGWLVGSLAPLLRRLAERGHEIACHGYAHQHLARLSPKELREDLHVARARIEDAVGVRPVGYRAPTFSITRATAWALDTVIAAGFEYDASIFPIRHDRYGVPAAPTGPFWAVAPSGARILEFPPLTLDWRLLRIPIGGGGYLRLLPGAIVRRCVAARERHGRPTMIYVHPWELDPGQPRLPVGWLAQWRHRVNLDRTEEKLKRLLRAHRFDTARSILGDFSAKRQLPRFAMACSEATSETT
jgi:polysaccharide deacetylase family protein (PEP-CTERM system associated)